MLPIFAWKLKHSPSRAIRGEACCTEMQRSLAVVPPALNRSFTSTTELSTMCTSSPTKLWGHGTTFHDKDNDDPVVGTPMCSPQETRDALEQASSSPTDERKVEDSIEHRTTPVLDKGDTEVEEKVVLMDSQNRVATSVADDGRVRVPEQQDADAQEGQTTFNFMKDIVAAKVWEEGTSPIDFVQAIGSGQVWHDFFPETNDAVDSHGSPSKSEDDTANLLHTIGDFVQGDGESKNEPMASRSPSPTLSRREQARAMNSISRGGCIRTESSPSSTTDVMKKDIDADRGRLPADSRVEIREVAKGGYRGRPSHVERENTSQVTSQDRTRKEYVNKQDTPAGGYDCMQCFHLVEDINASIILLLLGDDQEKGSAHVGSSHTDSRPTRSPTPRSSRRRRTSMQPTRSTSNGKGKSRSLSPRRSRRTVLVCRSPIRSRLGSKSTVMSTKSVTKTLSRTRASSVHRGTRAKSGPAVRIISSKKRSRKSQSECSEYPKGREILSPVKGRGAPRTPRVKRYVNDRDKVKK